jgi:hypothetical protein
VLGELPEAKKRVDKCFLEPDFSDSIGENLLNADLRYFPRKGLEVRYFRIIIPILDQRQHLKKDCNLWCFCGITRPVKKLIMPGEKYIQHSRVFSSVFIAALLFSTACRLPGVTLLGNPFTFPGADYQIYSVQGIDPSHPSGETGISQGNLGVEFPDGIGVSYDQGNGTLHNFGLGLYTLGPGQPVESTGLRPQYNQLIDAFSVTIRVEDFDLMNGATSFNKMKVEPSLVILGPNNTIFARATPQDIFPNLRAVNGSNDVWDINFRDVLNTLHLGDGAISGFLLYADNTDGEKVPSDPYFLVSVGNGIPAIPEPGNYVAGLAAIAFALLSYVRQLCLQRKAVRVRVRVRG